MNQAAGLLALALVGLAGCSTTRWRPEAGPGLLRLPRACPGHIGPQVDDFGDGMRAVYTLVVQGASAGQRRALDDRMSPGGFAAFGNITMNRRDIIFVRSGRTLRSQADSDAEFAAACRLDSGPIYLTHVRYNAPADDVNDQVRVR